MMRYDYRNAMIEDIKTYIFDEHIHDIKELLENGEAYEILHDEMWAADSVTGNGSGSYTFSRYQAEENLNGNLALMVEAFREFDCCGQLVDYLADENFEAVDVTIRCYLLSDVLTDVLNDYETCIDEYEAE